MSVKSFVLSLVAILLVLGALALVMHGPKTDESSTVVKRPPSKVEKRPTASARQKSKPIARSSRVTNEEVLALLKTAEEDLPPFSHFEKLARGLSERQIEEVLDEVGILDSSRIAGWLRGALFAEWGVRNPKAAMAYFDKQLAFSKSEEFRKQNRDWSLGSLDGAILALHRGWGSVDPGAALVSMRDAVTFRGGMSVALWGDLQRGKAVKEEGLNAVWNWKNQGRKEVFRSWASQDLEGAIAALPEQTVANDRGDAWRGIFESASSMDQLLNVVTQWEGDRDNWAKNKNDRFQWIHGHDDLVLHIAHHMSEFDLHAARDWLVEKVGDRNARTKVEELSRYYARRHPNEALALVEDERFDATAIIGGIVHDNPQRARELVLLLESSPDRYAVLMQAAVGVTGIQPDLPHPRPGWNAPIVSAATRRQAVKEALEVAELRPDLDKLFRKQFERDGGAAQPFLD